MLTRIEIIHQYLPPCLIHPLSIICHDAYALAVAQCRYVITTSFNTCLLLPHTCLHSPRCVRLSSSFSVRVDVVCNGYVKSFVHLYQIVYQLTLTTLSLSHPPSLTTCTVASSLSVKAGVDVVCHSPRLLSLASYCLKSINDHTTCLHSPKCVHSRRRSAYELAVYVVIILAYCNLYQINYQDLPLCLTLALHLPRRVRSRRRSSVRDDILRDGVVLVVFFRGHSYYVSFVIDM